MFRVVGALFVVWIICQCACAGQSVGGREKERDARRSVTGQDQRNESWTSRAEDTTSAVWPKPSHAVPPGSAGQEYHADSSKNSTSITVKLRSFDEDANKTSEEVVSLEIYDDADELPDGYVEDYLTEFHDLMKSWNEMTSKQVHKYPNHSSDAQEDPSFPANWDSVFKPKLKRRLEANYLNLQTYIQAYYDINIDLDPVVWVKPRDLCERMGWDPPQFVVKDFSMFDLNQGRVGDCWFVAAAAHLTRIPRLLKKVIPEGQSFDKNYTGIFDFSFWKMEWVTVTVDDWLPCETKNGEIVGLLGVKNPEQPNEFWGALLEKAYAKLYGSYQAIHGGYPFISLHELTQGIGIEKNMSTLKFSTLVRNYQQDVLMTFGTGMFTKEEQMRLGIVERHAYTVTGAVEVIDKHGRTHQLIRLRNPYGSNPNNGMDIEWTGAWGDTSDEWDLLPENCKSQFFIMNPRDGEFWIPYGDVRKNFLAYTECTLLHNIEKENEPELKNAISHFTKTFSTRGSVNFFNHAAFTTSSCHGLFLVLRFAFFMLN